MQASPSLHSLRARAVLVHDLWCVTRPSDTSLRQDAAVTALRHFSAAGCRSHGPDTSLRQDAAVTALRHFSAAGCRSHGPPTLLCGRMPQSRPSDTSLRQDAAVTVPLVADFRVRMTSLHALTASRTLSAIPVGFIPRPPRLVRVSRRNRAAAGARRPGQNQLCAACPGWSNPRR